jgi:putative mRNA 3-end processing factor
MAFPSRPESWVQVGAAGLYCVPADLYIDPHRAVDRALLTHGHSDHARAGHRAVLATEPTLAILKARYGEAAAGSYQALAYGQRLSLNGVQISLVPAGHVLGSAQAVLEWQGQRVVVSGDFKRRPDPTCAPFEPVPCDVFVTEATFGLPVFRHPPAEQEVARLLHSVRLFPESCHIVGAYTLGKAQRLIALLRQAGWERPLFLHGAMERLCQLYQSFGVELGWLRPANRDAGSLPGEIVLAPPSAVADRWARRFAEPVTAVASGWMRVRARARQARAELPLVISDHADWDELLRTLDDVAAPEVWVTHGNEEALIHAAGLKGIRARALALIGRGEEDETAGAAPAEAL